MYSLKIENKKGEILELTQNESNFIVTSVKGFNPPTATINTSKNANTDGSSFNSTYLNERNVVLTIKPRGDVEKSRLKLYEFLGTSNYCKIYYSNGSREVYCEGYVETVEADPFTISQEVQASILCADPYLYDLYDIYTDISKIYDKFEFPFAVEGDGIEVTIYDENRRANVVNVGEVVVGVEITLYADTLVKNPIIYNEATGQFLKLNTTIDKGEIIIINTSKGKKSIKKYVDGIEYNIINTLTSSSTWHQLVVGENIFTYSADDNPISLHVEFVHNTVYKGA